MSTVISFLLDRTGSMASIKDDVIGGFNEFLKTQRDSGEVYKFVLTLFDSQSIDEQTFENVRGVPELTQETYLPRAATPLLDAIGKTIARTESTARRADDRVLFVIYTDGQENASVEFKVADVKRLVEEKQGKGWEFIFLGAGIDAYSEASQYGIPHTHTFSTGSSGHDHRHTLGAVGQSMVSYAQADSAYANVLRETEEAQTGAHTSP